MKAYWLSGGIVHALFTSVLDGGEWLASHPGRCTPRERVPDTHWIGGWIRWWREKFPAPAGTRTHMPIAQRYTTELSRLFCDRYDDNSCWKSINNRTVHSNENILPFVHDSYILRWTQSSRKCTFSRCCLRSIDKYSRTKLNLLL
jgi:hypothetical protein